MSLSRFLSSARRRAPLAGALLIAAGLLAAPVGPVIAGQATPPAQATPEIVAGGIDLANMDRSADPGVDFNEFVNGGWLKDAVIRPDRSATGSFNELSDELKVYLIDLLARKAADPALDPASDEGKAVAYFAQGMDMTRRNADGIAPLQPMLDKIAAIGSLDDYYAYQQSAVFDGVSGVLGMGVGASLTDSDRHALYLGGPYYGLPNRDYYLDETIGTPEIVESYIDTNAKLLAFAGYAPEEARRLSQAVFDYEKALVGPTLTREEQQDANLSNNPYSLADLQAAYPAMDWTAYQQALGIPVQDTVIVTEKTYLTALPEILAATDVETIKAALALELIWGNAGDLSDEIGDTAFAFGKILSGREKRSPLEERVLGGVQGSLGQAVGKLYVEERFSPAAKAEMERLTQDILTAFRARLEAADWMTPETKAKALEKLANVRVKVGYPDTWETYEDVELGPTYVETSYNAFRVQLRKDLDDITKPVDRDKWNALPQTVNAFYSPTKNEIVFPAGILQAPFFDLNADPALNYGGIGYVIGHEITHGFDLEGSQFDAKGNLADWWTDADRTSFEALNQRLVDQYSGIEAMPGKFVNGQMTVTENAADLGGIQVAYDALMARLARDGSPAAAAATPVASGGAEAGTVTVAPPFTPQQQFYIAAATIWRENLRDAALATAIDSGVHSPSAIRAVQPLRNHDPFYAAFGIEEGVPMWLAPEDRVVIW
ncbi:MAG: M13 family metallopeptidase [Thermomicrobiales bacterium]